MLDDQGDIEESLWEQMYEDFGYSVDENEKGYDIWEKALDIVLSKAEKKFNKEVSEQADKTIKDLKLDKASVDDIVERRDEFFKDLDSSYSFNEATYKEAIKNAQGKYEKNKNSDFNKLSDQEFNKKYDMHKDEAIMYLSDEIMNSFGKYSPSKKVNNLYNELMGRSKNIAINQLKSWNLWDKTLNELKTDNIKLEDHKLFHNTVNENFYALSEILAKQMLETEDFNEIKKTLYL